MFNRFRVIVRFRVRVSVRVSVRVNYVRDSFITPCFNRSVP